MKYNSLATRKTEDYDSDTSFHTSKVNPCFHLHLLTLLSNLGKYISIVYHESHKTLKESFASLESCPKELYVNFALKFCESYNYFAISQILVIYLHEEFGLSDMAAGGAYGLWGAAITFWGLTASWLNDNLGVRRSLLLGFTISFFSTMAIALTRSKNLLFIVLFAIYPIGTSMGIPMLTVGIRRYTNPSNRGFAYGLYYAVMNIAAFVSGPVVDILNVSLSNDIVIMGLKYSGNRLVIMTASIVCLCSVIITYTSLREIRVSDSGENDENHFSIDNSTSGKATMDLSKDYGDYSQHAMIIHNPISIIETDSNRDSNYGNVKNSKNEIILEDANINMVINMESGTSTESYDMINISRESSSNDYITQIDSPLLKQKINGNNNSNNRNLFLSSLHEHEHSSNEKNEDIQNSIPNQSKIEEFLPTEASIIQTAKELLFSPTFWRFTLFTLFLINLNAVFRHLDATLPTYLVREFGKSVEKGVIYSINPFIIILITPIVAALTSRYAHYDMIKYGGYVSAVSPFFLALSTSIWATVCFVCFLSFGEAIWSPRIYDYTMSIAPEGREASFAALSSAPLFAAKVPVGLMSGYLISTYIPEHGHKDGKTLWMIIGFMTLSSPILITLLEKYIREPSKRKDRDSVKQVEFTLLNEMENDSIH